MAVNTIHRAPDPMGAVAHQRRTLTGMRRSVSTAAIVLRIRRSRRVVSQIRTRSGLLSGGLTRVDTPAIAQDVGSVSIAFAISTAERIIRSGVAAAG